MDNRQIIISTGATRLATKWKPESLQWSDLVDRLKNVTKTQETKADYARMSKQEQGDIKDVGGFVGGYIKGGGRRVKGSVLKRSLITLDADYVTSDFKDKVDEYLDGYEYVIYSTHSHTKEQPKLRIVIPMDVDLAPDAYEAVARKLAEDLGINTFDPTTFEPERLMYWPSCSRDAKPIYIYNEGNFLPTEAYLAQYEDWRDVSLWPIGARAQRLQDREYKKQGNPEEKPGIIGAFNRCYKISEAIALFLADDYEPCINKINRYTYKKGSTTGGLVVYDNDLFAYSHHGTDPSGGKLCNAYDLVRTHLFGALDDDVSPGTKVNQLPSTKAMIDFVLNDERVKVLMIRERIDSFDDSLLDEENEEDFDYMRSLEVNSKNVILSTPKNILTILRHDPRLKDTVGLDTFSQRLAVKRDLPWRKKGFKWMWEDSDDACLRNYLSNVYGITGRGVIDDCLTQIIGENCFHPVTEYLDSLVWDGVPRIDTFFIDYLGADDTTLNRQFSRKWFLAGAARVYDPGCKFDNAIVLVGPQGLGKTLILQKLGKRWFNNSIIDLKSKDANEQLQGSWIIELGEMAPALKTDVENTKGFISRQEDKFRVPYGRRVSEFKRQCIFAGTTNSMIFLKDRTGNRRFWPIVCHRELAKKHPWDKDINDIVDQVWAEAAWLYSMGEDLIIDKELEQEAITMQQAHTEGSEKLGLIEDFLDMYLPPNWYSLDDGERFDYYDEYDEKHAIEKGYEQRDRVCAMEVFRELFGYRNKDISNSNAREINEMLANIPGWMPYFTKGGTSKLRFGKLYGLQRAFVRVKNTIL